MAVVFADGFEVQHAQNSTGFWTSWFREDTQSNHTWRNTQQRTGVGSLEVTSTNTGGGHWLQRTNPANLSEYYIGFGFKLTNIVDANAANKYAPIMNMMDGASNRLLQLAFQRDSKLLAFYRDNVVTGTFLAASTNPIVLNQWHYIEFRAVMSATVGVLDLRLDGTQVINFSGNTHSSAMRQIHMGMPYQSSNASWSGTCYFDDLVIFDTTGSVANGFPNQAGIYPIFPTADGALSQWASTGGNNWQEIDDVASWGGTPDGDTTRLSDSTVGNRVSVNVGDLTLPAASTIHGLTIHTNARLDAAAPDTVQPFVRLSGVNYDQTAFSPGTSYAWFSTQMSASPATSTNFTVSEINGMELGYRSG